AHPFLERWLKNRFHPKSLWGELKRYGPEWLEKFPQVPHLIFNGLQQIQNLNEIAPELENIARKIKTNNTTRVNHLRRAVIAIIAFGSAVVVAWPQAGEQAVRWASQISFSDLPTASYILAAIAVAALLF